MERRFWFCKYTFPEP